MPAFFSYGIISDTNSFTQTKHFQTLFWTPEVRLVDCPGLVMPNLVPMETQVRLRAFPFYPLVLTVCLNQVLSGILPISRVSAVPLCIYHTSQLLPLETILGLSHPSLREPIAEDKRTWREPRTADSTVTLASGAKWTAMDILTAYALKKGWVTAKAGRPDVNRAGNASKSLCIYIVIS